MRIKRKKTSWHRVVGTRVGERGTSLSSEDLEGQAGGAGTSLPWDGLLQVHFCFYHLHNKVQSRVWINESSGSKAHLTKPALALTEVMTAGASKEEEGSGTYCLPSGEGPESQSWAMGSHTSWEQGHHHQGCDRERTPDDSRSNAEGQGISVSTRRPQSFTQADREGAGVWGGEKAAAGSLPLLLISLLPLTSHFGIRPLFFPFSVTELLLLFHRLPEKHVLCQSRPPLFSSWAQQLQSAPSSRTQVLSPIALQPANLVHLWTPCVQPHAAHLVHQCASGVSLLAPVHKPESGKCKVGDCCKQWWGKHPLTGPSHFPSYSF